uniref:Uncharacterized protein n=1 Tax=Rhizophora mucronata TaxID=61149 RepID=A0A2P2QQ13_RHIMU
MKFLFWAGTVIKVRHTFVLA